MPGEMPGKMPEKTSSKMPSQTPNRTSPMGRFAWGLVALLAILHYDFWLWNDRSLVFGFVPIGLFSQLLISIGAAIAWALVVRFAWPVHIEEWAQRPADDNSAGDE